MRSATSRSFRHTLTCRSELAIHACERFSAWANTVAEVLRRVGISRVKFYQEISAGRLRARKIGRKAVVLETDLQAYFGGAGAPRWSRGVKLRARLCSPLRSGGSLPGVHGRPTEGAAAFSGTATLTGVLSCVAHPAGPPKNTAPTPSFAYTRGAWGAPRR